MRERQRGQDHSCESGVVLLQQKLCKRGWEERRWGHSSSSVMSYTHWISLPGKTT